VRNACALAFAQCRPVAATSVLTPKTWMALALISLATSTHRTWSANVYTLTSDIFRKRAIASVPGLGAFMGGMGRVVFTALRPGCLVTHFGYVPAFVIMGSGRGSSPVICRLWIQTPEGLSGSPGQARLFSEPRRPLRLPI
jgi:ACS family hexuronate transporter-like MFS transporter